MEKRFLLQYASNIEQYDVTVYDGERVYRQRISTRKGCLCLCVRSPCLRVVASPLSSGYSTKLYYWIDTTCKNISSLYFNFPINATPPSPVGALNTFTLTDRNYGLPIDGLLLFTQN